MSRRTLILVLLLLCAMPGCGPATSPPPGARRLVVVAVDGASWQIFSPLMAAGRMPVLAGFYRAGSVGILRSLQWPGTDELLDPESLYTSLATGKPPRAHGITATCERGPGAGLRPATADRRRVPAIWNIAGAHDLSVGVVGWPVTFPVEPVKGFMVADGYEPGSRGDRGYLQPPDALGTQGSSGEPLALSPASSRVAALDPELITSFNHDLSMLGSGLALYRVYQPTVSFFRFTSLEISAHKFWAYHESRYLEVMASRGVPIDPARAGALADVVNGTAVFFDEWLRMLSERLPEKATIIVVSTYGMRGVGMTDYIHLDMDRILGMLPPNVRNSGARIAELDVSGGSRRSIYLEMNPIPGSESTDRLELLSRVGNALRTIRTEQGDPLLTTVTTNESPRPGEPDIDVYENMGIDPAGSIRIGTRNRPVTSLFRRYSDDFAAHDRDGIILAAGQGIVVGHTKWTADLYDLVPTVLALLGLPQAADMPGTPIAGILTVGAATDQAQVPTYDHLFVPIAPKHRPDDDVAREMERLRGLSHLRR